MSDSSADLDRPFASLDPSTIITAIESLGFECDGRLLALNSYENRVYRVGIEDQPAVVAKFYRNGRWSRAAILEEHAFTEALLEAEIPVVAPLEVEGRTLHEHGGYLFGLYPLHNGRAPELEDRSVLEHAGRLLGRIHANSIDRHFEHRPSLSVERFGHAARDWLLANDCLPDSLLPAYTSVATDLLQAISDCFLEVGAVNWRVLHGDAHPGNLLARGEQLALVDFDDAMSGPAVQDLWLFLAGDREEQSVRLRPLLRGYTCFADFDPRELRLIEALRGLRIMHHAAWLAQRWLDPAFPIAFPWFEGPRFWDQHVLSLREQVALIHEPALSWEPD